MTEPTVSIGQKLIFYAAMVVWIALAMSVSGKDPEPVLKLSVHPPLALAAPGGGGAVVRLDVEITGKLTEKWYCPEVVFLWPDGTRSRVESDCVVWEDAYLDGARPQTRWSEKRGYPPGEWDVTVELRKGGDKWRKIEGKLIAREMAVVRVQ